MKLARVVVSNFRNLLSVDVRVDGGAVIVGENRSGKSNLLHAVRLVLDPTLTSAQRTLTVEDFSDTLGAPLRRPSNRPRSFLNTEHWKCPSVPIDSPEHPFIVVGYDGSPAASPLSVEPGPMNLPRVFPGPEPRCARSLVQV